MLPLLELETVRLTTHLNQEADTAQSKMDERSFLPTPLTVYKMDNSRWDFNEKVNVVKSKIVEKPYFLQTVVMAK